MRGGRFGEVPTIGFWLGKIWSFWIGGCLREVVAHGGSTVLLFVDWTLKPLIRTWLKRVKGGFLHKAWVPVLFCWGWLCASFSIRLLYFVALFTLLYFTSPSHLNQVGILHYTGAVTVLGCGLVAGIQCSQFLIEQLLTVFNLLDSFTVRIFVKAGTQGPLLSYYILYPVYFYTVLKNVPCAPF